MTQKWFWWLQNLSIFGNHINVSSFFFFSMKIHELMEHMYERASENGTLNRSPKVCLLSIVYNILENVMFNFQEG